MAALAVTMTLVAGCGDAATTPTSAPPTAPAASTAPAGDPLVEWCRSVDADFCVLGLGALAEDAGRRTCVLASTNLDVLFDCLTGSTDAVTTTAPRDPGPEPTEEQVRAWRLAAQDEIERVLPLAHPEYLATAGLVLAEPLPVPQALDVATRLGRDAFGAWMAAPVCVDGRAAIGLGEGPESVRFAYLDGEAEVARREAALTADGSPITGRHVFDEFAAEIVQASEALHEPGVLVEAIAVRVVPGTAADLATDPQLRAVRLVQLSPEVGLAPGDLSDQPPAC